MEWLLWTSDEFIRATNLALKAGAHEFARKVAMTGASKFQSNTTLQTLSAVLSPPRVAAVDEPAQSKSLSNFEWITNYSDGYADKWVALKEGELVGVADSAAELKQAMGDTSDFLVTKIVE